MGTRATSSIRISHRSKSVSVPAATSGSRTPLPAPEDFRFDDRVAGEIIRGLKRDGNPAFIAMEKMVQSMFGNGGTLHSEKLLTSQYLLLETLVRELLDHFEDFPTPNNDLPRMATIPLKDYELTLRSGTVVVPDSSGRNIPEHFVGLGIHPLGRTSGIGMSGAWLTINESGVVNLDSNILGKNGPLLRIYELLVYGVMTDSHIIGAAVLDLYAEKDVVL